MIGMRCSIESEVEFFQLARPGGRVIGSPESVLPEMSRAISGEACEAYQAMELMESTDD